MPELLAARARDTGRRKALAHRVQGHALLTDHAKHAPHDGHFILIHLITYGLALVVAHEPEAEPGRMRADYLSLAGLLHPAAPGSLGGLDPLPLRHPAFEEPQELALVRVVAPVI